MNIKYHNTNRFYLRQNVQRIEIDERDVSFINGLAVVKGKVVLKDFFGKEFFYESYGVINENYEEAFESVEDNDAAYYLMFRNGNKKITRIGENDFIVLNQFYSVLSGNYKRIFEEKQIRLINNVPVLLNTTQLEPLPQDGILRSLKKPIIS